MVYRKLISLLLLGLLSIQVVYAQGDTNLGDTALPLPVGGYVFNLQPDTISAMQAARMTWVKAWIGSGQDADLVPIRDFIEQGHQAGFKVLLTVTGDPAEIAVMGDDYFPVFAEFVEKVASLGPDGIEVWTAMNTAGQIDSVRYVSLLAQAHTAIKAVTQTFW